jgi:anti-anti-sigma regulatory factor
MPIDCKIKSKTPELVLFVHGSGTMNANDIQEFSNFFEKHLYGSIPFKLFIDLRDVKSTSGSIVQNLVKKMTLYEKFSVKNVIATSVLINNSIIENLINILFTIRKPITPTKITSDIIDACNFLNEYSNEEVLQ